MWLKNFLFFYEKCNRLHSLFESICDMELN